MEKFKKEVREQFMRDFLDGVPEYYIIDSAAEKNAKVIPEAQLRQMLQEQAFEVNYVADTYLLAILNIGGVETIITPLME